MTMQPTAEKLVQPKEEVIKEQKTEQSSKQSSLSNNLIISSKQDKQLSSNSKEEQKNEDVKSNDTVEGMGNQSSIPKLASQIMKTNFS